MYLALALALAACHVRTVDYPPVVGRCDPARIGTVRITGSVRHELRSLIGLEGTFDDLARTDRMVTRTSELLRAQGWVHASLSVTRRTTCNTDLDVMASLGPRFRIAELTFEAVDDFTTSRRQALVARELGAINTVGGVYREHLLVEALGELADDYRAHGWFDVRIDPPRATYDDAQATVRIRIAIQAGKRYQLRHVTIEGFEPTVDRRLQAELGLRPGAPYDPILVDAAFDRVAHDGVGRMRVVNDQGRVVDILLTRLPPASPALDGLRPFIQPVEAPTTRFLGVPLPPSCEMAQFEDCTSALRAGVLADGILDDHRGLHSYVAAIAARIARGSELGRAPQIFIVERGTSYAVGGDQIVLSRGMITRLESEAELAAVLAHEIAHLEGAHGTLLLLPSPTLADARRALRDTEELADERATELLARAGYDPRALVRVLPKTREETADDGAHPPWSFSMPRLEALTTGRGHGVVGRDTFRGQLRGVIVGRDRRRGTVVGDAWIVARLELALPLSRGDRRFEDLDLDQIRDDGLTLSLVGVGRGRELAAALVESRTITTSIGEFVLGFVPPERHATLGISRYLAPMRAALPRPNDTSPVAILIRGAGALVIRQPDLDSLVRTVGRIRHASAREREAAETGRIGAPLD